MGDKVTIQRNHRVEEFMGKSYNWSKWECSCGASARYLNVTARDIGSERHADTHRSKK